MSKEEKRTYFAVVRRRYAVMRTKRARSSVLDDFCGTTGLTRKHAIKILSPKRRPCRRRGRPPGGTPEGTALLARKLASAPAGAALKSRPEHRLPAPKSRSRTLARKSGNRTTKKTA